MDRLYVPDHNHIFRIFRYRSSGDFPRFPGLKYDDLIMKNGPKSDRLKSKENENNRDPPESIGDLNEIVMARNMGPIDLI